MGKAARRKRERREARRLKALAVQRAEARGCLFCRRSDGGFISEEHILPECLGNTELVLERGVVCDRCNNEKLSRLDQTLCEFKFIKAMRTFYGIRSKNGTVPTTRTERGVIERTDDSTVSIRVEQGKEMVRKTGTTGDEVQLQMDVAGGPPLEAKYAAELTRALLKVGLELVWHDHGSVALDATYDHIRSAVLGAKFAGGFAVLKKGVPSPCITVTYRGGSNGEPFVTFLDFRGMVMAGGISIHEPADVFQDHAIFVPFDELAG